MIDVEAVEATERAVLFASMHNPVMRSTLMDQANIDWFMVGLHRKLFRAIHRCFEDGSIIDTMSIYRTAREQDKLMSSESAIESDWLAKGSSENSGMTPTSFAEEHMPYLRQAYQSRKLSEFFIEGMQRITEGDPSRVLAWASAELTKVGSSGSVSTAMKVSDALLERYSREMDERDEVALLGPYTRMPSFDAIGFRLSPNEPVTIAAKPAHGKTIISTQIAVGASTQCGVAVMPIEDGHEDWITRLSIAIHGKSVEDIRRSEFDSDHANFTAYCHRIKDRPLYIAKNCKGMTSHQIIAFLQKLKTEDPTLGVCIIDQAYRMGDYGRREIKGETQTEAITRQLTRLAQACSELGVCLVMMQHVKKDLAGEPTLADISDSYIFERLSRKILLINRPNYQKNLEDTTVNVNFAKWTMSAKQDLVLDYNGSRFQIDNFIDPDSVIF